MEQLYRLETNESMFYRRDCFTSIESYEEWRNYELEYVQQLINKWCQHTSRINIRAFSIEKFDAHEEFTVIAQKFMRYNIFR